MNARTSVDERLRALAEHLDDDLAARVRALVDADSHARTCQELVTRAERAEGVLAEIRRQFDPLQRALDRAHEENRELRRRYDVPWGPLSSKPLRDRVQDSQQIPVLPAPPPPPPAPRIHG